jgi:mannitol/fructose-specific phosphotransferase system IIA component
MEQEDLKLIKTKYKIRELRIQSLVTDNDIMFHYHPDCCKFVICGALNGNTDIDELTLFTNKLKKETNKTLLYTTSNEQKVLELSFKKSKQWKKVYSSKNVKTGNLITLWISEI